VVHKEVGYYLGRRFSGFLPRFSVKSLLCSTFVVGAISFGGKAQKMSFQELDKLFDDAEYDKVIEILDPKKDEDNDEQLWRLARALYQKSKTVKNDADKKKMLQDAYALVQRGLALNESNFANHKWDSILLDAMSQVEGTKERIVQSEKVKKSMQRAVELNPNDATCYHVLGMWCFSFADLPWYQRQIASVVFATPPTSTYEEALTYFEKGEEVNPGWYSTNLLMLGKTHMKLNNKDKAIEFLTKCKEADVKNEDDKQANKESVDLLKSLGVKS